MQIPRQVVTHRDPRSPRSKGHFGLDNAAESSVTVTWGRAPPGRWLHSPAQQAINYRKEAHAYERTTTDHTHRSK